METTDILKLKKPSQNDFYNVNDFNANMDILEAEAAKAKARQATLLVHAPAGYSIEVVHQSCAYTAVSTAVGNDAYATIVLPFGGCATINFRQNTQTEDVKCTLVEDLIADGRDHVVGSQRKPFFKKSGNRRFNEFLPRWEIRVFFRNRYPSL